MRRTVLVVAFVLAFPALVAPASSAPTGRLTETLALWADEGRPDVRVLVQYAAPPEAADATRLAEAGFTPLVRYSVVPVLLAAGPASRARDVAALPGVVLVEADEEIPLLLASATDTIRARGLWTSTHTRWSAPDAGLAVQGGIDGRGVGIAVVDSGVDATHPDLLLRELGEATGAPWTTLANYKVVGRDSVNVVSGSPASALVEAHTLAVPTPHSDNTGGHGTHVAGAAVGKGVASDGRYRGSAPAAHLVGYGAGEALVVSVALAAFDHIHAHHEELGIRVVSNSWGGPGDWQPDFAVTKAAQRLVREDGLVVVFAAGNSGGDGSGIATSVWANIPEVLSVANFDRSQDFVHATSSRGRIDLERTWPDVAAVGTNLVSAAALAGPVAYYGNAQDVLLLGADPVVPVPTPFTVEEGGLVVGPYASFTGTSMATPMVSGVVAMMLQANPALAPAEVHEVLRATAAMPANRSYGADGHAIGRGLVDASRAVAVALRLADGLSFANALLTATASGEPLGVNEGPPDAGRLDVTLDVPATAPLDVPLRLTATATGGEVFAPYVHTWDLDDDGEFDDATSTPASMVPRVPGPARACVRVSDGASVAERCADFEVVAAEVVLFFDDAEAGGAPWIASNGGTLGAASGWEHRRSTEGVYLGGVLAPHSGSAFWHAGVRHTPASGGWAYLPGARATLTLADPVAPIPGRALELGYSVQGQSMAPLVVEAQAGAGPWTQVDAVAGNFLFGGGVLFPETRTADLSAFADAGDVRIRFVFEVRAPPVDPVGTLLWTFFESGSWGGWGVDDVSIVAR